MSMTAAEVRREADEVITHLDNVELKALLRIAQQRANDEPNYDHKALYLLAFASLAEEWERRYNR